MTKSIVATLIQVNPAAHGVGIDPEYTERKVYATMRSVGMQEVYQAMADGLNPELKIVLTQDFEYKREPLCQVRGVMYKIIRTYVTEADEIELTLQRVDGNAADAISAEAAAAIAQQQEQTCQRADEENVQNAQNSRGLFSLHLVQSNDTEDQGQNGPEAQNHTDDNEYLC
jgi:hypothetical protein